MTKNLEAESFGKINSLYDRARVGYPNHLINDIITYSGTTQHGKVLDVGCGSGQATIPFAQRGYNVIALDISQEMIELVKNKCSTFHNVSFKVGSFEDVELYPEHLDIIVSGMAWHWISPEKRLEKAHRILKSSGAIALIWSYQLREKSDFIKSVGKILDNYGRVNRGPTGSRVPDIANHVYHEAKESKLFVDVEIKEYAEEFKFSKQRYIDLVTSYGWVQLLPEEKRRSLIYKLTELCGKYKEPLIIPYKYVLVLGRKN